MSTMKNYIAIIDLGYNNYDYEKELFNQNGYDLKLYAGNPADRFEKARFVGNAIGILVRGTLIDAEFFKIAHKLKAVVRYGVGYDNVDIQEATRRKIKVANVQGYANHAVSDHAIALLYACTRSLTLGNHQIRNIFSRPPTDDIFELHDKTVGIIGLGRIGKCFASKVCHLFKDVLAVDPYIHDTGFKEAAATKTDLKTLLTNCHVISIHCNLTAETNRLLDRAAFMLMKNRPVLINTARGQVVCQDALVEALNNNQIHSAGIDVFNEEPPTEKHEPLFNHPRAIVTGHYAWYSDASIKTLQHRAADNMIKLLTEQYVEDQLNKI
jgi:D-3-phosphoglycerate dehydrogenase / 2-oxoglutarate reductase